MTNGVALMSNDAPWVPRVGQIIALGVVDDPGGRTADFEVVSVDLTTGMIHVKVVQAGPDGRITHLRVKFERAQ